MQEPTCSSRIFLRPTGQNTEHRHDQDTDRIIQVFDDGNRGDGRQFCCHEHLGTVWDNSLNHTRESIKNTGTLTLVHTIFGGDVVGQRTYRNDGNGIVGRTDIGNAHQSTDTHFGSLLAIDLSGKYLDDVVHTTIKADKFEHASCHEGDDDEFAHAIDSATQRAEPVEEADTACAKANGTRCDDSHQKHKGYIEAHKSRGKHHEVGDDFHPFDGIGFGRYIHAHATVDVIAQCTNK